jgi:hypothetical protein
MLVRDTRKRVTLPLLALPSIKIDTSPPVAVPAGACPDSVSDSRASLVSHGLAPAQATAAAPVTAKSGRLLNSLYLWSTQLPHCLEPPMQYQRRCARTRCAASTLPRL